MYYLFYQDSQILLQKEGTTYQVPQGDIWAQVYGEVYEEDSQGAESGAQYSDETKKEVCIVKNYWPYSAL